MRRPSSEVVITIEGAELRWIYTDDARALLTLGEARITRASHVEPHPAGGWIADLSPVAGPTIGPFPTRTAALAAERDYLNTHVL